MLIDIMELIQEKEFIELHKTVPYPYFNHGQGNYKIVNESVDLDLQIFSENQKDFVLVGTLNCACHVKCDRCMKAFEQPVTSTFQFENPDEFMDGKALDLNPLIQSELILNFPPKLVCDPECKGLCKQCGVDLNVDTCDCQPIGDVRLAGLRDLYEEHFKEV